MSNHRSSRAWKGRLYQDLLLLGLLLMLTKVTFTSASDDLTERETCMCLTTVSTVIHPKLLASVKVIDVGPHCPVVELIGTLKDGQKICLDPQVPLYKKIIKKLMKKIML